MGNEAMEHKGILSVGRTCSAEARGDTSFDEQGPPMEFVYHHNISRGVIIEVVCHVDVG
jgi:hypothetical protein